jgi:hypothetical protein
MTSFHQRHQTSVKHNSDRSISLATHRYFHSASQALCLASYTDTQLIRSYAYNNDYYQSNKTSTLSKYAKFSTNDSQSHHIHALDLGPELLPEVPRWGLLVAVCLDLFETREKVHLGRSTPFCPLDELVADPQDGEEEQGEVVGHEGGNVEFSIGTLVSVKEDGVGREKEDDRDQDDGVPSGDGVVVKDGSVRKRISVDTLCLHSLVETNVGERDTPPGQETTGGSQVGEVTESFTGRSLERHVGKPTKQGTYE